MGFPDGFLHPRRWVAADTFEDRRRKKINFYLKAIAQSFSLIFISFLFIIVIALLIVSIDGSYGPDSTLTIKRMVIPTLLSGVAMALSKRYHHFEEMGVDLGADVESLPDWPQDIGWSLFGILLAFGAFRFALEMSDTIANDDSLKQYWISASGGGSFIEFLIAFLMYLIFASSLILSIATLLLVRHLLKPYLLGATNWIRRVGFYLKFKDSDNLDKYLEVRCHQCCTNGKTDIYLEDEKLSACSKCKKRLEE